MSTTITIYSTPNCHYCHALMDWLDRQGIAYEEKDAEDPTNTAEAEKALGHEIDIVPITVIGDDVIENFDRPAILKALEKHGLKK